MKRDAAGFGPTGYLSGFHEIDDAIGGFKKAKLYYIVANEKVGKSALVLTVARQFLLQDIPVGIFSLEMTSSEVGERFLVMESSINTVTRRKGHRLTEDEAVKLSEAADRCNSWPVYCNDMATLSPSAIIMNARHAVKVHGTKVIIVDYVQIVGAEDGEKDETRKRVEKASRALAKAAKELDVPVIALAQLNRKTVERASGMDWQSFKPDAARPRRGDIRETAQLEMDADAVIAIYRPEIFYKELRPFDGLNQENEIDFENTLRSFRGKAELNILVNRSGPDGVRCKCEYKAELGLFVPYARKV
jgi:replicative DNA helicase